MRNGKRRGRKVERIKQYILIDIITLQETIASKYLNRDEVKQIKELVTTLRRRQLGNRRVNVHSTKINVNKAK